MATVQLASIDKHFGKTQVLDDISIDIETGEFLSILGPSGCGKTTLLRIIAGLESVSRGSVRIAGEDVTALPPEKRNIAMMFQSYALLPHLSVAQNVQFPLRMRRVGSTAQQVEKVANVLETVQLAHLADRKPAQLSGGQQQRVALARAIVSDPAVLLLDEPLSNLDARLREQMQIELIELHQGLGLTTIFVTHDQEEALSLSDRIVLLNNGRIEQQGSPSSVYFDPGSAFVSRFMGSANIIQATLESSADTVIARLADQQQLPLPPGIALRGLVQLSLRQEDLHIQPLDAQSADTGAITGSITGRVRTRVFLGARNRYLVEIGGTSLCVLTSASLKLERGQPVSVSIAPDAIRVVAD